MVDREQVLPAVRRVAGLVLRAPLQRGAFAELGYLLLALPLGVLGFVYVAVSFALSVVLAVTAIGIPLLGMAVPGARGWGSLRRRMSARVLGVHLPAPEPFVRPRGLLLRVSAGLRDAPGWRAIGYLAISLPLALVSAYVLVVTWGWGLIGLTSPIQQLLKFNQSTVTEANGAQHQVVDFLGLVPMDTWFDAVLTTVIGAAFVMVGVWAARGLVLVDRLLIRVLLGPTGAEERIRRLERSRAYAIDDVAATVRRIERDLHDGVQARMVALSMSLTMLAETLDQDELPEQAVALLGSARAHATDAIVELREMVSSIHPPALDDGLATALTTLAARSPIAVDLHTDLSVRPIAAIETIAYFSVAELLTNVTKHSGADRATVLLTQRDDRLVLVVTDNGQGGADPSGGSGLRGLTKRVGTVDGTLAVRSPVGGGTTITIEMPLHT